MFTIDQNITEAQLKEKDLCKALFSLNSHEVATPDMSLEEARSYVFFFREGKSRMSVYIGLHLIRTDRKLFYTHSANPFLEEVLLDLEDEARNFAEGLGAFLDVADFANMSGSGKTAWIEDQSIFSQKKETEPAPAEQAPPVQSALEPQPVAAPVAPPAPPVQSAPEPPPVAAPVVPAPPVQSAPEPPPVAVPVVSPAPRVHAVPMPQPVTPPPASGPPDSDEVEFEEGSFEPHPPKKSAPAPLAAAANKRQEIQEIMDKAIKAGIAKPPKQSLARELTTPTTSMVSRDREALARLLTSF